MMAAQRVDLAIVGAGIAGVYIAGLVKEARPDRAGEIFERTGRIRGRLRSVSVPGVAHGIELGGMRFLSSHARIESIVHDFGLATRPFNADGRGERLHLRGVVADGPADPAGGANYALEA